MVAAGGLQHIIVIVTSLPVPGVMEMCSCHPHGRYRVRSRLRLVPRLVAWMQVKPDAEHQLPPHLRPLLVVLMLQC